MKSNVQNTNNQANISKTDIERFRKFVVMGRKGMVGGPNRGRANMVKKTLCILISFHNFSIFPILRKEGDFAIKTDGKAAKNEGHRNNEMIFFRCNGNFARFYHHRKSLTLAEEGGNRAEEEERVNENEEEEGGV